MYKYINLMTLCKVDIAEAVPRQYRPIHIRLSWNDTTCHGLPVTSLWLVCDCHWQTSEEVMAWYRVASDFSNCMGMLQRSYWDLDHHDIFAGVSRQQQTHKSHVMCYCNVNWKWHDI